MHGVRGIRRKGRALVNVRRDEAYVLRTQELGESDLIVSLFAREHGKVRGVARAARKSRRRYGGALEPLTHVRLSWTEKAGRELHRIESLDCLRSFAAMQGDPALQAACAVLSEISDALSREGQCEPRAFQLLGAVLGALEHGCDPWIAVRYFEFWMLRIHGLLGELESCATCGSALGTARSSRVDRHGAVRCARCASGLTERQHALGAAEREFLDQARRRAPGDVTAEPATVAPGHALEAALRGTLESFVERRLRTYRHLDGATRPPGDGRARR